jgi:radical SAM superfamily enzyme YgiQ (UPF0313 family)
MEKEKVVITGAYIPGIYPPGKDDVVVDLLAPGFLKASLDADPEITRKYDTKVMYSRTDESQEEVAKRMLRVSPSIIGYSTYLWNYNQMVENSSHVKRLSPKTKIVFGGPQVSYDAEEVLKENPQIDVVVRGSGELRFKEMLKKGITPKVLSDMNQISYRQNGDIKSTNGEVIEDLSQIPSPYKTGAINIDDGKKHTLFLETFRGCPFKCQYCTWGGPEARTNRFPLEQILDDVEQIYNHPNVEYVCITDANLFYTPQEHWKPILEKMASSSRKIPTVATLDIRVMKPEMVDALSKVDLAFNQFHFGMQSTNQEALKITDRRCKNETWSKGIDMIRETAPQIDISLDMIYGLPGDNFKGFKETVDFALGLNPSRLYLFPLLVLPGTPFWERKEELGFELSGKPDYMVKSNNSFSHEDMLKSIDFSMWFQTMQRFPAVFDALLSIPNSAPGIKRIDIIDEAISSIKKQINPIKDEDFDFTGESNNEIRRKMMDSMSQPENCLRVYDSALNILNRFNLANHDDVSSGREIYHKISDTSRKEEQIAELENLYGKERMGKLLCNWIIAGKNSDDVILTND